MVSSTGMTLTPGIDAGFGEGTSAATSTGRAAAPCRLAVRYATASPQRVRAFERVEWTVDVLHRLNWRLQLVYSGPHAAGSTGVTQATSSELRARQVGN